jgi:2-oxoglutarate ferredoxin oxidoreductase subunit alpha
MAELPLVFIDVQRAGPSTGLPTKNEQSDLLEALYGRHGEAPLVVLAASSPVDCFWTVQEAAALALEFMTPVIVLSDGYLANCAEPWKLPKADSLPPIEVRKAHAEPGVPFKPYQRDPKTGARPWAVPGTPGLEHRIGGLEKKDGDGTVNYEPGNHETMTRLRAEKIRAVAKRIPACEVFGDASGDLLVLGWGGTFGSIRGSVKRLRDKGLKVSHLHLRHLNPLPPDLAAILAGFKKIVVAEVNQGQLLKVVRAAFALDAEGFLQTRGRPLSETELEAVVTARLVGKA